MHELITSDLCDINADLSLSRGRSKNNRRKDKSCNNGRAAHDHAPFRGRAKTSLPDRALIIDTRVGGKKLIDRLSTKSNVEDGKSVTSSPQPNGGSQIGRASCRERGEI